MKSSTRKQSTKGLSKSQTGRQRFLSRIIGGTRRIGGHFRSWTTTTTWLRLKPANTNKEFTFQNAPLRKSGAGKQKIMLNYARLVYKNPTTNGIGKLAVKLFMIHVESKHPRLFMVIGVVLIAMQINFAVFFVLSFFNIAWWKWFILSLVAFFAVRHLIRKIMNVWFNKWIHET